MSFTPSVDLKTIWDAHTFANNTNLDTEPFIKLIDDGTSTISHDAIDGQIEINTENLIGVQDFITHSNEDYRLLVDIEFAPDKFTSAIDTSANTIIYATAGDTITRASGSWVTDGFGKGDRITVSGTVSNDTTTYYTVSAISALIITVSDNLTNETISTGTVTTATVISEYKLKALMTEMRNALNTENATVGREYYWKLTYGWNGLVKQGTIAIIIDCTKEMVSIV